MKSASKIAMNSPFGDLQAGLERAGLVAGAVGAMDVVDVDALRGEAPHGELGDLAGFVGRVVEHLDFEQLARIVDPADRFDQPIDDVHFVVERQLDRDRGQRVEPAGGHRLLVLVLHVQIHKVVAVPPVNGEDDQDEEVRWRG